MSQWSFITNHARALLYIAAHPDARLRDLAAALEVTERSAFGIVTDLTDAGYVVKERDGRRNRYHIQDHLPMRGTVGRERTIGEVLDLLAERPDSSNGSAPATAAATGSKADSAGHGPPVGTEGAR